MEVWRRLFREEIVENYSGLLADQLPFTLKEVSTFGERVGEQLGPVLRMAGFNETDIAAELYAAQRACQMMASANQAAGIEYLKSAGAAPRNADAEIAALVQDFAATPEFHAVLLGLVGHFSDPSQAYAVNTMMERVQKCKRRTG